MQVRVRPGEYQLLRSKVALHHIVQTVDKQSCLPGKNEPR